MMSHAIDKNLRVCNSSILQDGDTHPKIEGQAAEKYASPTALPLSGPDPPSDVTSNMCGPQLAEMLGCWAATNDLASVGLCSGAAEKLFHCMRTTVCLTSAYAKSQPHSIAAGSLSRRKPIVPL